MSCCLCLCPQQEQLDLLCRIMVAGLEEAGVEEGAKDREEAELDTVSDVLCYAVPRCAMLYCAVCMWLVPPSHLLLLQFVCFHPHAGSAQVLHLCVVSPCFMIIFCMLS